MKDIFNKSIVVLILWIAAVVLTAHFQVSGTVSLNDLVQQNLLIGNFIAVLILFSFLITNRSALKVGFAAPQPAKSWLLLWFPLLFVIIFFTGGLSRGLPASQAFFFIFINTLLVGISEELMFRGIFFSAALKRFSAWKSIWLVSVAFGLVHSLNGFLTGDFLSAFVQSLAAMMSGFWFMALRIRTKSLYPPIIIHFLWDFSLFLFTSQAAGSQEEVSLLVRIIVPVLFVLPLFLYGLFLLRKKRFPEMIEA